MKKLTSNIWVTTGLLAVIIIGGTAGVAFWLTSMGRVYTDKAIVSASITNISPSAAGILQEVYVNVGDVIGPDTVVARVGNELLKTTATSVVTDTNTAIGTTINPGVPVVKVVNPDDLRVVAHIDEDKGLSSIKIGDQAIFRLDAFGSRTFQGVVDEISASARQEDIVFNISDKRQINQFDVKIRFDVTAYPQIKNGMSAKVWIYNN
ncbi:MAG TPA: HlyD family efflux transporter periplasmic adaptor subunit [Candidatus Paceibacterota bacterium]|nr:HlyD family efflux transporter periplasmic adaptor subunit [Candidatus Paceibacterota bacterium]